MEYPGFDSWDRMVKAIDDINTLAFDDEFREKLEESAVRKRHAWIQEQPVCIERDSPQIPVEIDMRSILTSDPSLTVSNAQITAITAGGFYKINGSFLANSNQYYLSSEKDQFFLFDDALLETPLDITPDQLKNFLLIIAYETLGTAARPEFDDIVCGVGEANTPLESLTRAIEQMGHVSGISSTTTSSIFSDKGNTGEVIVTRHTTFEEPHESEAQLFLQSCETIGQVEDVLGDGFDGFFQETRIQVRHHLTPPTDSEELALSQSSSSPTIKDFAIAALRMSEIDEGREPTSTKVSSKGDAEEVRTYALLCERFLKLLSRIRG